jgi:hypothetical protein
VLPGPLQDGVAGAVEAVTPFDLPTSDDSTASAHVTSPDDGARDAEHVDAGSVPTTVPPPSTAAPSSVREEQETEVEVEHGAEAAEGTHRHRGGATATAPVVSEPPEADDDPGTHTTEVGDSHGGDADDSGHRGGDDSGGGDDSSGHGGGDH